ncbi:hypothetical protein DOTSEDRAFT_71570 [Dothistroma septosporum NZE10]|uniref:Uncharacterized protein n=1 Tax=Dothistroma septosporum (strain NZE10 / CBS 128990) TaxID=675120 RepID=N1PKB3_DOTSN|nr:hypothetical protein DOTSEDRAFT_71570 [Dothistroma septosporum NZE10]
MAHKLNDLDSFEPSKAGAYDPGEIQIFYDNRAYGGFEDKLPSWQKYWLGGLSRLSRPALWYPTDLMPGYLRIVFYTNVGNQGAKDYPLHKAMAVKDMFDSLSEEGHRPMVYGYSNENPFPMLGGVEPPQPKKKQEPKRATTWSHTVSGHSGTQGETPHDRVMAIIQNEEERLAKERAAEVEEWGKEKGFTDMA